MKSDTYEFNSWRVLVSDENPFYTHQPNNLYKLVLPFLCFAYVYDILLRIATVERIFTSLVFMERRWA